MSWQKTRSDLGVALKRDPNADVTDLRRKLRAERLLEHVQQEVAKAPEFTDEQRIEIAAELLKGSR
jgi:hypothetical protein